MVGSSLALAKWKQNTFSQTTCWKITSSGNTGKPTMHQRKHQPYNIMQTFLPPPANWNPPIPNNTELNLPYANRTFPFGKKIHFVELFFYGFFCQVKGAFLVISTQSNQSRLLLKSFFFPRWWWPLVHRSSKSLPAIYLLLLAQLLQSKSIPINCICWRVLPSHPQSLQTNRSCSFAFPSGPPYFMSISSIFFALFKTQTNIIFQFAHCACQEKVQHSSCSKRCTQIRNSKFQVDVGLFGLAPASQRKEW